MSATLSLSERVNVLVASFVGIEAEQHRIAAQDPTGSDRRIGDQVAQLSESAFAVVKEIEAIEDTSGNADLAAALILVECMLHHDYAALGSFEWGEEDRLRLKVLAALAGATTGEVRRHTAAVLATVGATVPDEAADPFLAALERYRTEGALVDAWPEDASDEAVMAESEAILDRLFSGEDRTPPPCTTMAGAVAGIRQVFAERPFCDQVAEKLLRAVLAFLEGRVGE